MVALIGWKKRLCLCLSGKQLMFFRIAELLQNVASIYLQPVHSKLS